MNAAQSEVVAFSPEVQLQAASEDIWRKKYQLTTKDGEVLDNTVDDTYKRVARALAEVEQQDRQEHWYERFLWALRKGAVGAGRIMSNAGAKEHKPSTSTINCTVSMTVGDSIRGILEANRQAGITLSAGCGIGYEFSTLRPKGAFVAGVGATTGGALAFMDIFDSMCFTISSAGGRRGAQMGTLDVCHPDVREFIRAKREAGRLRQFNLSLLITDSFIEAVKQDGDWLLVFPVNRRESLKGIETVWRDWPSREDYMIVNEYGQVQCRVYGKVKARGLWDVIMQSTYDFAEPGFILIDEYNEMNNNWWCENIRATNPCGEQGLPPFGSCLLGSINLTKFVVNPFTPEARFDWASYEKCVAIFTRMLDNVVEINGLPLPEQRHEITSKRRHGMGYLGLGSTLSMLCMRYGSAESIAFTEEATKVLAVTGWRVGVDLAVEKGPAPIMNEKFVVTPEMARKRRNGELTVGSTYTGKELFSKSRYMQRIFEVAPDLEPLVKRYGVRFTHHSSIAPTGTISLSFGNNASNGIEPTFAHEYARNVIREGKKTKEKVTVYSYEALLFRELFPDQPLPDYFSDASTITPKEHVDIQAAAQKWIDSSISKTVNVPTDISFDDFKDVYMYAYDKGLKGCTTFRYNPAAFQGVLVNESDLANTIYVFELENGEKVELRGNEEVEYDGETHTAANLFDALKEGYYGKF